MKFIDLFCGIGSFHYSFKKLGWECIMSCDIDKTVKETYLANYGLTPLDDITKINPADIPEYDILCAGFPCQPFSQCGLHKGFSDERENAAKAKVATTTTGCRSCRDNSTCEHEFKCSQYNATSF
ncbi:MAG: hypothetical protein EB127_28095 [Alphaproteobacteria bacterium]|nr:hypothetical protein [Alphaproteobacteria bacterium]